MRKRIFYSAAALFLSAFPPLRAADVPGIPRDSNFGNTGGYDGTKVEAHLRIDVGEKTETVHFIRDNNDPRVVTKTYLLKNVDAYEFRDYLRQMVQSKRVGNSSLQQIYPGNTTTTPVTATTSYPELNSAAAQPGYTPTLQLGSNTAVECLRYADGSGLLMVSAEEYRFKDNENGIGIDTLVAMLDDPAIGAINYGSQMFLYLPKFVPAANLMPLIQNVGMNVSDVTELWQGQDIVTADTDLNWLIFDVSNFSCENISRLLAEYDRPIPQVQLKIKVYEVSRENDERIGIDFQSWKNNEGADFFSIGGRYRSNWAAMYHLGELQPAGSERSNFFVFNPKWNSRYLDFLTANSRAKVIHSGELCLRNNTGGSLVRRTQLFYSDDSQSVTSAQTVPDTGVGAYRLLSEIIGETLSPDIPVAKGYQQIITRSTGYGFSMVVENASVNLRECRFRVTLSNSSLIGFASDGSPRISAGNTVTQDVSLPFLSGGFVIGGLSKKERVVSRTGVPWLMDIPGLGKLFSSESESVKHSELIVVAHCEWASPDDSDVINRSRRYSR